MHYYGFASKPDVVHAAALNTLAAQRASLVKLNAGNMFYHPM